MEDVEFVHTAPLPDSPYVKPFRLNYTQAGKEKTWDLLEVHDSVAVIVFNVTRRVLVFVKQFRPAVYLNCIPREDRFSEYIDTVKYPASLGVTVELCAGIVDKKIPLNEIAMEEVLEECGYKIDPYRMQEVMTYRAGVGVQGSKQTLFYAEVTDDMKVAKGGGVADEIIDLVEMDISEVEHVVAGPSPQKSPPSCLFGLAWFLLHKAEAWRKAVSDNVYLD